MIKSKDLFFHYSIIIKDLWYADVGRVQERLVSTAVCFMSSWQNLHSTRKNLYKRSWATDVDDWQAWREAFLRISFEPRYRHREWLCLRNHDIFYGVDPICGHEFPSATIATYFANAPSYLAFQLLAVWWAESRTRIRSHASLNVSEKWSPTK